MSTANENGVHLQRLDPNQIDVVLGSARAPRPPRPSGQGRGLLWVAGLAVVGALGWGMGRTGNTVPTPAPRLAAPVVAEVAPEPAVAADRGVADAAVPTRVISQATVVVLSAPPKAAPVEAAQPVEHTPPAQPQGLVSAAYLAQFKAGATRPSAPAARPYQVATVTIREWDGPNRYVAKWRIEDNEIDQASVCFNFPADSIEHRECRRAAQQHFRNQCKDWTRRAEKARDRDTRDARTQYCAVAQSFEP